LNRGIARRGRRRQAKRRVGFLKASERAQRARRPHQLVRIVAGFRLQRHLVENRRGVRLSEHQLQQAEFERRLAGRSPTDHGAQRGFGLRVAAARDRRARSDSDDVRVASVQLVGERLDLVVFAFDERAIGELDRRESAGERRGACAVPNDGSAKMASEATRRKRDERRIAFVL